MFQFKQFTIHQDRTAMKVCTDACVLGAYADVGAGGHLLDIGTGTGLLALMIAQRNPSAQIDAVEVDDEAARQAAENVAESPFAARMQIMHQRIQDVNERPKYDRIITNPPFYTNQLRSPDPAVRRALHADELPLPDLLKAVVHLLKANGQWWVLLPPAEANTLIDLARKAGLHPFKRLSLRHHAQKPVFRSIIGFSYGENTIVADTLHIYELDGRTYTPDFRALLVDFYLIF